MECRQTIYCLGERTLGLYLLTVAYFGSSWVYHAVLSVFLENRSAFGGAGLGEVMHRLKASEKATMRGILAEDIGGVVL